MKIVRSRIRDFFYRAFNLSILYDKRLTWVDYLRGIAIVLVVYHHVRVGIERSNIDVPSILVNANMVFYSFRMPLFFILSGIFINRTLARKTTKQISWIKFENLVYPYLIWAFIQVTLQILLGNFTNSNRSLVDYTYIFYQPRMLDQFWYLPALFNATMFFLFVRFYLRPKAPMQLIIGLLLYFLSPLLQNISMLSDWMEFYIFFAIGSILTDVFFNPNTQKMFRSWWALPAIIPLFMIAQLYYLQYNIGEQTLIIDTELAGKDYLIRLAAQIKFLVIALIGCLTILILSFKLEQWNILRFLRVLGTHSLYIYVMHVLVIGFIRLTLVNVMGIYNPIILLFSGLFFGILIPTMFYNLLVRDSFLWFLFYCRKPEKRQAIVKEMHPPKVVTS
jgi:fucose 4-O-acetylase-like acetyltransferase